MKINEILESTEDWLNEPITEFAQVQKLAQTVARLIFSLKKIKDDGGQELETWNDTIKLLHQIESNLEKVIKDYISKYPSDSLEMQSLINDVKTLHRDQLGDL